MTTLDMPRPAPHLPDAAAPDADGLSHRLDDAARARRRAPLAAAAALAVVGTAALAGPVLAVVVTLLVAPAVVVVHALDRSRRTVTVACPPSPRHERLVALWERHRVAACQAAAWEPAVWEVAPQGVHHAVARRVDGPRHLRADVAVPALASGHRDVAFLPDRLVLREGRRHHVLGLDELEATATVRERAEGGRLGRLTLRVAGRTVTYDLTSVAAARELAAALARVQSEVTGSPWASPTVAL
ncbi:hypothetical protein [Actinomycetospora sp. TBRC 11914]|uniref:hypothetical protein n=1 Tax=Actinomycetospora sp. TBRC 11914 TaxID=2729387 RepID=UPI00145CB0E1|nr:hypothetical protein [Actinomycetospora sp. TBRC 11914]NMO92638.1 hypothetical protein [Actinomycetospora sp. TBRC 11914]